MSGEHLLLTKASFRLCLFPILAVCAICVMSCSDKSKEEAIGKKETDRGTIGKYLYMSSADVLHSRKGCSVLRREKDSDGHDVDGIDFVDTALICPNFNFYYCKRCFTDEQYEHVQQIIERNRLMKELSKDTSVVVEKIF